MSNTVSIIVPTFNRAHYLPECLNSLLSQTIPAAQIIVVDDGSEDNTAEVVKRYGDRVHYIYKENGGKPTAVNLALTQCTGTWIWLFDDDDVALPDAIENRLKALEGTPDAGFVYSPHFLGADGINGVIEQIGLNQSPTYPVEQFFLEIMKSCFFHLATTLVKRDLYTALQGLDPILLSSEDYDFQIRLAHISKPAFCKEPTFIFRQHEGVRGAKKVQYSASQRSTIFRKYGQVIGKKLYASMSIGEYLVPVTKSELTSRETRKAILNRIQVMASHGCLDEFFEDIRELLALAPNIRPLPPSEVELIEQAICTGWAYDAAAQNWASFVAQASKLKMQPNGRQVISALAWGIFRLAKSHPGLWQARLLKATRASRLWKISLI